MYVLRNSGTFWALPKGCNHCGLNHEQRRYNYEYAIRSFIDGLDDRGFVVDNLRPSAWFDALGEFEESCEQLAKKAAHEFAGWCLHPHSVTVRITGFGQATVEYTFDCEKEQRSFAAE